MAAFDKGIKGEGERRRGGGIWEQSTGAGANRGKVRKWEWEHGQGTLRWDWRWKVPISGMVCQGKK